MADSIKTGIGFLIPVGSLIGFIQSLLSNDYITGIIFIIGGLMIWMLYILVVESTTPTLMGNILIVFIVLLSLAVFLNYGLAQNIWGGYELKSDGSIIALLVLFFGGLIGLMYRQHLLGTPVPSLSAEDQSLVNKALGQNDNDGSTDPKVIVVKQEVPQVKKDNEDNEDNEDDEEWDYSNMYAYPPEYYEDYYDDEDDEDDE